MCTVAPFDLAEASVGASTSINAMVIFNFISTFPYVNRTRGTPDWIQISPCRLQTQRACLSDGTRRDIDKVSTRDPGMSPEFLARDTASLPPKSFFKELSDAHPQHPYKKRVVIRGSLQPLAQRHTAPMPGARLHANQNR